jgi:hypothetical protein
MLIPIIAVALLVGLNMGYKPPKFNNAQELATWANCDPHKIAYATAQSITYVEHKGWEASSDCLKRRTGDCKCLAITSRDALNACGYEASIVSLHHHPLDKRPSHAIAVFTDNKGRRGYINGVNARLHGRTEWADIFQTVPGGPWQ